MYKPMWANIQTNYVAAWLNSASVSQQIKKLIERETRKIINGTVAARQLKSQEQNTGALPAHSISLFLHAVPFRAKITPNLSWKAPHFSGYVSFGVVLETTTSLKFEAKDRHNVYLVAISVLETPNEMLLSS